MKSKKILLVALILLVAFALFTLAAYAKEAPAKETGSKVAKAQTMCPVLKEKINKKIFTDYKGKRIYFCCPKCVVDFKKDPEKYMKIFEKEGVTLENAPKKEPVKPKATDKPVK